jgi:NTP pyrophosphatase (non-canonical NTP hydrolase)
MNDDLQRRLFDECVSAGWDPHGMNSFAEECAHLHEEVSEAFREWRLHKDFAVRTDPDGKPTGIPIELADVLIGLFYNAELHGFDLLEAVEIKHQFNLRRSYATEGRQLHPDGGAA